MRSPSFMIPHGSAGASAYVCIPVEENVAARSTVMTALMETEGMTELPMGIEVADYLSWSAMRPTNPSTLSGAELSTALQVGDLLGDNNVPRLALALSHKLGSTDWEDDAQSDEMLAVITPLHANVQRLVFDGLSCSMDTVLAKWPLALQQAYVDARVASGNVTMSGSKDGQPLRTLLTHLARSTPAAPGLRTLTIQTPVTTAPVAALLSHALLHHASTLAALTFSHLALASPDGPHPAVAALRHLPRLSALTSIDVSHPPASAAATADTAAALATGVRALRGLARFRMHVLAQDACTATPPPAPASKRIRLAAPDAPPPDAPLDALVAALSAAPALTSLTLSSAATAELSTPGLFSGVRGPFQRLQRLDLDLPPLLKAAPGAQDAPLVAALLPSLTYMRFRCASPGSSPAIAASVVEGVVQQAALREADLHVPHLHRAAATLLHTRLHALPHLQTLSIEFGPCDFVEPTHLHSAMAGLARLPALQQLELTLSSFQLQRDEPEEEISAMFQPLAALTQLRELRVNAGELQTRAGDVFLWERHLLQIPLRALTQLTSLHMDGAQLGLDVDDIALHLLQLPRLCELRLHDIDLPVGGNLQGLVASLSRLTALDLGLGLWCASTLQEVAEGLRGLPDLQRVVLSAVAHDNEDLDFDDRLEALGRLPARGLYTLQFPADAVAWSAFWEVQARLVERGATVAAGPQWITIQF